MGALDLGQRHASRTLARNESGCSSPRRLDTLASLLPDTAERVTQLDIEKVPLAALRVGDVVLVRPGSSDH